MHRFQKNLEVFVVFIFLLLSVIKAGYQLPERAIFEYDQEYLAQSAKSIITDNHFTLIGAPTSVGSMFIGPFYNYVVAFALYISHWHPLAISVITAMWGPLTTVITYFIVKDLFNGKVAIFTSLFLITSFSFNYVTLNPPLIHGMSVLVFIVIWSIIRSKDKPKYLIWGTLALGFSFHLHFSSLPVFFLALIFLLLIKPKLNFQIITFSLVTLFFFLSPLVFFDFRHGFLISKNALQFISFQNTNEQSVLSHLQTLLLSSLREFGFLLTFNRIVIISRFVTVLFLLNFFFNISREKTIYQKRAFLLLLWIISYLGFFYFYHGPIVPYYFTPIEIPFFVLIGFVSYQLWQNSQKHLVTICILILALVNFTQWYTFTSPLGLFHKMRALEYIKQRSNNKPIYLSHTIARGLEGGFSYLEWYMAINKTDNQMFPVYTLVLPYNWVDAELDYRSGQVGVINPKETK